MTEHVREKLSSYVNKMLPLSEIIKVEKHLDECASCAQAHDDLSSVLTLMKSSSPAAPRAALKTTQPRSFFWAFFMMGIVLCLGGFFLTVVFSKK